MFEIKLIRSMTNVAKKKDKNEKKHYKIDVKTNGTQR